MGRMEPLSDLYHDNIIMPSAPRVLFRLLFRLPVKERGLSADAEGNAEDERDGGAEQTEAPGGTIRATAAPIRSLPRGETVSFWA